MLVTEFWGSEGSADEMQDLDAMVGLAGARSQSIDLNLDVDSVDLFVLSRAAHVGVLEFSSQPVPTRARLGHSRGLGQCEFAERPFISVLISTRVW